MTSRTILGNVQNIDNNVGIGQQGGKILQVANWLTGKVSAQQNKENISVQGGKENILEKKLSEGKVTPRYGIKKSNKKL